MTKIAIMLFSLMMFLSCDNPSNYEKGLALAKETNKTVMLKLTSPSCHFCKKMDDEVLSDTEVVALLKKSFILVDINVKKESVPLDLKYKVTPTFFFMDKNEKVIYKIQGSWNKKDFMELLEMVLKKVKGDKK